MTREQAIEEACRRVIMRDVGFYRMNAILRDGIKYKDFWPFSAIVAEYRKIMAPKPNWTDEPANMAVTTAPAVNSIATR